MDKSNKKIVVHDAALILVAVDRLYVSDIVFLAWVKACLDL